METAQTNAVTPRGTKHQAVVKPPWLKVPLPGAGQYRDVRHRLRSLSVHTVCEEAHCPNAAECWGGGTATFMLLGARCTRHCRFCAVDSVAESGPIVRAAEQNEPSRVAEAAHALGLKYVVLTSVTRDDLPDGGAAQFAQTVAAIQERVPEVVVEVLTPDFGGSRQALATVAGSQAGVLGHNLETVRELTPAVRDARSSYDNSLNVLRAYRELGPRQLTKSSLLLGMGETTAQVEQTLADMRRVDVDWVTLGQYLRPTTRHAEVARYVEPAEFERLKQLALQLGFPLVTAGPLVRSSYRAGEQQAQDLLKSRSFKC